MFRVPCCDDRHDFRIKTMLGSSLPLVVCRRSHVLFTLFVFVYVIVVSNAYCVVFLLCLFWSCVPYVACFSVLSILIAHSVLSTVYLIVSDIIFH